MLIDLTRSWVERTDRACLDTPPDIWFPPSALGVKALGLDAQRKAAEAKAICATCPVLAECRRDTLGEPYGIWAGRDEADRQRERGRLTEASAKWPKELRLEWGRIAHQLNAAGAGWERVQVRTGLGKHLAKKLAGEYENSLVPLPPQTKRRTEDPATPTRPSWPADPGRMDAWAWHQGQIKDGILKARTPSSSHYLVQVHAGHSHAQVWLPKDRVHIYRRREVEIREKGPARGRKAA